MTSSLVGSEMCIRDRCQRRGVATATPGYWKGWRGRRMVAESPSTKNGSVSYTHLTLPTICSV
eukprot:5330104-Prorocentrum_lima.AAC.1